MKNTSNIAFQDTSSNVPPTPSGIPAIDSLIVQEQSDIQQVASSSFFKQPLFATLKQPNAVRLSLLQTPSGKTSNSASINSKPTISHKSYIPNPYPFAPNFAKTFVSSRHPPLSPLATPFSVYNPAFFTLPSLSSSLNAVSLYPYGISYSGVSNLSPSIQSSNFPKSDAFQKQKEAASLNNQHINPNIHFSGHSAIGYPYIFAQQNGLQSFYPPAIMAPISPISRFPIFPINRPTKPTRPLQSPAKISRLGISSFKRQSGLTNDPTGFNKTSFSDQIVQSSEPSGEIIQVHENLDTIPVVASTVTAELHSNKILKNNFKKAVF